MHPVVKNWKQGWIPRRTISWWKASLPLQNENRAFLWTFSLHFVSFNGVILPLKCRNSGLETNAWWWPESHFVENEYSSLRFPNMVKVNIHERWTRMTCFNPLRVSVVIYIQINLLTADVYWISYSNSTIWIICHCRNHTCTVVTMAFKKEKKKIPVRWG